MDIEISFIINMLNFRCLQNQGKATWQTMGYMSLTLREEAQLEIQITELSEYGSLLKLCKWNISTRKSVYRKSHGPKQNSVGDWGAKI